VVRKVEGGVLRLRVEGRISGQVVEYEKKVALKGNLLSLSVTQRFGIAKLVIRGVLARKVLKSLPEDK
jgi:hypothetical protein